MDPKEKGVHIDMDVKKEDTRKTGSYEDVQNLTLDTCDDNENTSCITPQENVMDMGSSVIKDTSLFHESNKLLATDSTTKEPLSMSTKRSVCDQPPTKTLNSKRGVFPNDDVVEREKSDDHAKNSEQDAAANRRVSTKDPKLTTPEHPSQGIFQHLHPSLEPSPDTSMDIMAASQHPQNVDDQRPPLSNLYPYSSRYEPRFSESRSEAEWVTNDGNTALQRQSTNGDPASQGTDTQKKAVPDTPDVYDTQLDSDIGQESVDLAESDLSLSGMKSDFLSSGSLRLHSPPGTGQDEESTESTEAQQMCTKNDSKRKRMYVPLRFVVMCTVFLGMVIVNAMRTNIAVTVLTILDKGSHFAHNSSGLTTELPQVDWTTTRIGFLHAAFYMGYMITHMPAGYLTTRLPSHKLFTICIAISSVLNFCLPVAIQMGGYFVTITVRFAQGLSEGLLYPACYGILRHWSTPTERGRVGSLVLTGAYLGPAVGFPVSGVITDYIGWQYIYYVNGGVGVVYVIVWAWLSEEKPAHHKQISSDELTFIEDLQGSEKIDYEDMRIPWSQILTSMPVVSLCLCNFARNWVFIFLITNEPFYLNMFQFAIAENGAYSALPHVSKISAALTSGLVADYLLSKHLLSTTRTRKLLTTGFGIQAVFFFLLTLTQQGVKAMVLLTIAVGFGGFVVSGWQLNHYDLSARHASVLVAVTSTFGNLASITVPIVTGVMTERQTFRGWNQVFYITGGIAGLAWISFTVFGSGERQPWASPSDSTHLVAKEDKRRHTSPGSLPEDAAAALPCSFSYNQLHEASNDYVPCSRVPNYGSQDKTFRGT